MLPSTAHNDAERRKARCFASSPVLKFSIVTPSTTAVSESRPGVAAHPDTGTSWSSIVLVFLCTVSGAAAQILMKEGANHITGLGLQGILTNLPLLSGYALYGVNTLLMVLALRQGHLSVLYPIIALTFVWVTILSPRFFPTDHLNVFKMGGVALIVGGVSLIGFGSRQ
jgi:multidrug transporter EmrE-like cation transporter